jgi:hypothetical protein
VGVQTVEHVKALPGAIAVKLSKEEIDRIHDAAQFNPLFPNTFLYGDKYNTKLTTTDHLMYHMATWIQAPPKQPVSFYHCLLRIVVLTDKAI